MIKTSLIRQLSRASTTAVRPPTAAAVTRSAQRAFSAFPRRLDEKDDRHIDLTTAGKPGAHPHEGQFSRTDKTIQIEHPEEEYHPPSQPIQGRGGYHFKRTLASFSLQDRVGVVTGGARGLGLVMSQALVISGCDVAIVDLNSTCSSTFPPSYRSLS